MTKRDKIIRKYAKEWAGDGLLADHLVHAFYDLATALGKLEEQHIEDAREEGRAEMLDVVEELSFPCPNCGEWHAADRSTCPVCKSNDSKVHNLVRAGDLADRLRALGDGEEKPECETCGDSMLPGHICNLAASDPAAENAWHPCPDCGQSPALPPAVEKAIRVVGEANDDGKIMVIGFPDAKREQTEQALDTLAEFAKSKEKGGA